MNITATKFKTLTVMVVAISSLIFASTSFAGKGKGKDKVGPGKPGAANILQIAEAVNDMTMENEDEMVGEFEYLITAVGCLPEDQANTVVGLLTGEDRYTLFAPTNQAFRNLQETLIEAFELEGEVSVAPGTTCAVDLLLGEGTLFTVLAYHLTEGRRFSNSVFNKNNPKDIEMLAGGYITSTPSLTIIDGAMQTVNPVLSLINIKASNGVIHVIDTVLLPE